MPGLSPADPGVAAKLGITDEEWQTIKQLTPDEDGWAIFDVQKIKETVIELRLSKSGDDETNKENGQAGIAIRYVKRKAVPWAREPNVHRSWAMC